jgi:thiol:disulfide interchange protein DsbC
MKFVKSIAVLGLLAFSLMPAFAQEAAIRKNLAEKFPSFEKIDEVTKTPMNGLYEVRVGFDHLLHRRAGNYLIEGNLLDVKNRRNLTEERVEKLTAVDFDKLPLNDAIKIVRGDGKRKLAVFEDPNCGYCKRFERDLTKRRQRHRLSLPVPRTGAGLHHQVAQHLVRQRQDQILERLDAAQHRAGRG